MTRGTCNRGARVESGPRTFIRHGIVLAVAGVLLLGVSGQRPAGGAAPTVARIGYIAQVDSLGERPTADPAAFEVAAYAGLVGAREGTEEMSYTARLLGRRLELLQARATTPVQAVAQAEALIRQGVFALAGGFDAGTADALSRLTSERHVPFFNVGATDDRLRNETCSRFTFHVEASDAMYLDAMADWFIRGLAFLVDENAPQGVQIIRRTPARGWFLVTEDSPPWQARRLRLAAALEQRHWGGRIMGSVVLKPREGFDRALAAIARAHPDLVFLLLPAARQLEFYAQYERARQPYELTGFPEPVAQTRTFFAAALRLAPHGARGTIRFVSFEPTFQAIGGPQLAQRFSSRSHYPLDGPTWTSWLVVKIMWETFLHAGTTDGPGLLRYLESPGTAFEGNQGIGMTFRPWDHQLRHPLMASRLLRYTSEEADLAEFVGQFPNVMAPGRDPNDVLDQLGDTTRTTRCRWR